MNFRSEYSSHGADDTNPEAQRKPGGHYDWCVRCRDIVEMRLASSKVRQGNVGYDAPPHAKPKISIITSRTAGAGPIPFAGM
jgi:hypothetical protein